MHYVWLKLIIWLSTSYQNALFMCWVLTLCWNNVLWLVKTLPTFFNIQSALYLRRVIYLLRNSYMSLAQTLLGSPHSTYKGCIASCSSTIKMTRSVQIESKIFKADILRRFPHSKADGQNHCKRTKILSSYVQVARERRWLVEPSPCTRSDLQSKPGVVLRTKVRSEGCRVAEHR